MPGRLSPLVTGEIYHIYNRGANRQDIFLQSRDYRRFIQTLSYYRFLGPKPKFSKFARGTITPVQLSDDKKLVELYCYCLMPNHFHLLLKQLKDNGILKFLGDLSNSYVKYGNTKHTRSGPLFEGRFRSVLVSSDEQFLHVSRYIHLNPLVSRLTGDLEGYRWSSYHDYMFGYSSPCSVGEVLDAFSGSTEKYRQFVYDQASYGEALEVIKHQLLDGED
ncbi:MAG: hypothetical protein A2700_02150 [Candidatus Blackburnbacteria bacterium RIFCSPHIGHO2_01_FULL_44_64]|uniref:Transposase IS200-like domain-containing protein n=1 Tax=Candidatus Blackburnbacteria bacterium RIFCSPHIGHO2_02_FULL_44_20 TaxID=1797516 RepID=A0A1G1V6N1_9BACT|nr:MAG: hypothetical protein A2700_02150 [Candidatus Blackburnbacteria bacterium RIFCSPHIGHO2_01_FULL_44_64]OGY11039.1 MAG: hypothetical protein A3D26_03955 [Candidatus Blackburnbacteria bacterium RIFCSPHIGHO2_02_FULL_44_20]OGY12163.1 MAG: hypothetical protein A3E16_02710 [Candidatus Blackburnbacteria bacterium RIFCSPHIGHO2_12_FULL_44_25]OGY14409.1 MAG: hypothetical protein A3A62_01870 [Candidatus Blackburnbacteria bacterium RIFCSPLOWO2_01_FULL_44_43]